MKPSMNVPLTKTQRQALVTATKYYLDRLPNTPRNPALRNAIKRLEKVDTSPVEVGAGDHEGSYG